jgi:pimeloyl-ACP methyl ester carboxylesterase
MDILHFEDRSLSFITVHPTKQLREDLVLIFLHEALGSISQWRSFPEQLCNELGLDGFVYERHGHGNSSKLTKKRDQHYLHEYALIELPMLIERVFPLDKRLILVGHSDGGTISLLYAAKHSKRVHSIITMAAHVINETETKEGIIPAIDAFKSGKLNGLKKYHGDKTEVLFYAWADTWLSPEFENWNITKDIFGIDKSILAIQGKDDQYGTVKQLDLIRNSTDCNVTTLLIPFCGHHPHLEKPSETISEISKFLLSI